MKNKFRILVFILIIVILPINSHASSPIKIWINGNYVDSPVSPFIENNRTLVPVRIISENLGYTVKWGSGDKSVNIMKIEGEKVPYLLSLYIGQTKAILIDEKNPAKVAATIEVAPLIKDNRTFVPIRFIAEEFGLKVNWDADNSTVVIGQGYNKNHDRKLTAEEKYKLTLDQYGEKLKSTTLLLIKEYNEEIENKGYSPNVLEELFNSKVSKLSTISKSGIEEMVRIHFEENIKDSTAYEKWSKELELIYKEELEKISDVYKQSLVK